MSKEPVYVDPETERKAKLVAIAFVVVVTIIMIATTKERDTSKDPPMRCSICGGKIGLMDYGGKYCGACNKQMDDAREAAARESYLRSKR